MSLTHSQIKARPAWVREAEALRLHVEKLCQGWPAEWVDVIHREWAKRRTVNAQASAAWGFGLVGQLRAAERAGVVHGDTDADLCRKAEAEARQMAGLLDAVSVRVARARASKPAEWVKRLTVRVQAWTVRNDLRRRGLEDHIPRAKHTTAGGIVSRARDPIFWRRILRGIHAKVMEGAAIGLGLVHAGRRGGCYVSAQSLKRRRGQRARNAEALARTVAVNERGEAETIANLAARGVANGAVRRAELMTRISGFELIANDLGHRATMVTVTCPSRMHKWRRGKVMDTPNPAYDGTLPNQAQAYLAKQWARFRTAAARAGLGLYGFRIAEPHHDGCPHWHMLLWFKPQTTKQADSSLALGLLLGRYFLSNDSPDEPGADTYRIKVEAIDPRKGSAVAYVAKYVAKNIDGMHVGADLYGNPALESSARVEAWASTWRIRQFQQIGGAPVTVWRELRRVHLGAVPMDAAQQLHDALMMVNVAGVDAVMGGPESEQDEAQRIRAGWAAYTMAQGGPTAKRKAHTLRMLRDQHGEANRYGELGAPRAAGVQATTFERVTVGICTFARPRRDEVESERSSWVTASVQPEDKGSIPRVVQRLTAVMQQRQGQIEQRQRERAARGEAARPWTRVNNCTPEPIGYSVHRTPKRGEVFKWAKVRGGGGSQLERFRDEQDFSSLAVGQGDRRCTPPF